jgi:hypothetical protein
LDVTDLLSDWKATALDGLLTSGPLAAYCQTPQIFIVDQPEPDEFWIGRTVRDALHRNVGPVFALMRRLSRIEAMGPDHALQLVQQHHALMTWRDVAITPELEPVDVAWHGGPLTEWERRKQQQQQQRARAQARAALDREVEAFRQLREAELRDGP